MKTVPRLFLAAILLLFPAAALAQSDLAPEVVEKIRAALPDAPPASPKKPRKVLLFTRTLNFRHDSISTAVRSLTMMGKKTGAYEVVHTEDEALFEPKSLRTFDAVFLINTTVGP